MKTFIKPILYILILFTILGGCGNKGKSLFIEKIEQGQEQKRSNMSLRKKDISLSPGDFEKADYTIEECYSLKKDLIAKSIKVRGKVVKYNPHIMDRNWIHIQDGTGGNESFDLTVTSKDETMVGKIILISGKIMYDQAFGIELEYPVIVIDAKILEEK